MGAGFALEELSWAKGEIAPGVFDESFFARKRAEVAAMRAAGLQVVLALGVDTPPAWVLAMPGARFVNQWGGIHTASDEPNLVWGKGLRPMAAAYVAKVFSELGSDWYAVRVGGGFWGELQFPIERDANHVTNAYWAFDVNARLSDPVPNWRPGAPSPHGEAAAFLTWYLNGLVDYQNWQVATVRGHFSGPIAVLYPSYGMRPGDFDKAVADNLSGRSAPEVNGEVHAGHDHARQIDGLTDGGVAVWGTWADRADIMAELAGLARAKNLVLMGENNGNATAPADMQNLANVAKQYGLKAVMWIRLPTLSLGSPHASGADFKRLSSIS